MKRKILFLVISLVFLICLTSFECSAESEESINKLLEILPDDIRGDIETPITEGRVSEIIKAEFFLKALVSSFCYELTDVGRVFCILLSLCIFFSVASLIKTGVGSENMGKITDNALLIMSALIVYSLLSSGLNRVYTYIEDIKIFQNGLVPIMTGLYLSGGNTATAVASNTSIASALIILDNLCAETLPMLIRICFALTLISSIGGDVNYTLLCKSVRNLYMTALGFFTMIFSVSITFGTSLASSADSVAVRTVKYAIGNMIPIVGSTVNSAYGTLAASLSAIKNTVGVSSIVALLLVTVPIIIYLLLLRFSLNICASVSEMLGCGRIGKLYTEFRVVYDLALSAVVFCSLIFFIILSVFIKCTWAVA